MADWYDDHNDEYHTFDVAYPDLIVTDNPTVAVLYGPDGDVAVELTEREHVPFGFHPQPLGPPTPGDLDA